MEERRLYLIAMNSPALFSYLDVVCALYMAVIPFTLNAPLSAMPKVPASGDESRSDGPVGQVVGTVFDVGGVTEVNVGQHEVRKNGIRASVLRGGVGWSG